MHPIPPYTTLNFWIVLLGFVAIVYWALFFFRKQKNEKEFFKGSFEKRNKLLDIQLKRLAFLIVGFVICIICHGIYDYKKKNAGFYFKEFTVSATLGASGLNASTLKAQLQEIFEESQDYDYFNLTHNRISLSGITEKNNESLDINFQVQGIGFSLTHIANSIGSILFGDKRRMISVNLIEDSIAFKSIIKISGLPVQIFMEYLEDNYNRDLALQKILEKTEYNILETVSPIVMANYYYNKSDFARAMTILYQHIQTPSDPYFIDALYQVCYNCHQFNHFDCESRWLDTATKHFPFNKYFINLRAWQLIENEKYSEALLYVDKALKQDSIDYYSNINKGYILNRLGQTDKAILHFKKALLNSSFREPDNELSGLFMLSSLYLKKGMADSAEKYYLQAIDFDDMSIVDENDLINTLWLDSAFSKNRKAAKKEWTRIHALYPDYIPANYAIAEMCIYEKQYGTAEKYLLKCLAKNPKLTNARLLLGQLWKQQKTLRADSMADMLILERPVNFNALFLKAETQEILGNLEEAQKKYETVLQYDRLNWNAVERLAVILFNKGNYDAVMALITKYIETYPADPLLNHMQGIIFSNKGKFKQGAYYCMIASNNKIEHFYPDMAPITHKAIGMCNFELQNDDIAIIYLEKYRNFMRRFGKEADNDVLDALSYLHKRTGYFYKQKEIKPFLQQKGIKSYAIPTY